MNPVGRYFEQHVLSADPIELVRMLYKKAIALVQDARQFLADGDVEGRSNAINRVYDILLELVGSLNDEVAPELCKQLRNLYFYMQQRLLDANFEQSDKPLEEVHKLLTTLAEAWKPVANVAYVPVREGDRQAYAA